MKIVILGSTGSIGRQTLELVREQHLTVTALAAQSNIELLEEQIREFKPLAACVYDKDRAGELRQRVSDLSVKILSGMDGLNELCGMDCGLVVNAVVGSVGLEPTLTAIEHGHNVALANKETLVMGGALVMQKVREKGMKLLPIDSEHSAIFQCLQGAGAEAVKKLHLTASGGSFREYSREQMATITVEQALKHPNWTMGRKITVDSSTMMNKGLEVIEAHWLFGVKAEDINVIVHPQSIIHSMVEFVDGMTIAQLGSPDMRLPIAYAINYPSRLPNSFNHLDLNALNSLTFERPDFERFPCLRLAYEALEQGGAMPAVLNAANEAAVGLFLDRKIRFTDIPVLIEQAMRSYTLQNEITLESLTAADAAARAEVQRICQLL